MTIWPDSYQVFISSDTTPVYSRPPESRPDAWLSRIIPPVQPADETEVSDGGQSVQSPPVQQVITAVLHHLPPVSPVSAILQQPASQTDERTGGLPCEPQCTSRLWRLSLSGGEGLVRGQSRGSLGHQPGRPGLSGRTCESSTPRTTATTQQSRLHPPLSQLPQSAQSH